MVQLVPVGPNHSRSVPVTLNWLGRLDHLHRFTDVEVAEEKVVLVARAGLLFFVFSLLKEELLYAQYLCV